MSVRDRESKQKKFRTRNIQIGTCNKSFQQSIHELKASRDEYRFISELLPVGILIYQDGCIVYANVEAARLLRYTRAEMIGLQQEMIIHPDYIEEASIRLQIVSNEQSTVPFSECLFLCKDDTAIDVEVKEAYTLYHNLPSIMVVFRDITNRKQSEAKLLQAMEELEQSETRYRILTDLSPDAVLVISHGCISFANKKASELYGASSPEELIGITGMEHIHSGDREFLRQKIEQSTKKKPGSLPDILEIRIVTSTGKIVYTEASASPVQFKGAPSLLIVFRDITKRKETEQSISKVYEKIKQNNIELAGQKEKLQSALQYLSDIKFSLDVSSILVITDQNGMIVNINDKFCEISKYTKNELLGQSNRIINSGYHDPSFFKEMWRTIQNGNVWKGEIRNRAKDGTYYWVSHTIVPFRNSQGDIYQYMSIQHDITSQKENEEKLWEMNERLRALAQVDGLTGIGNRRFFDEELKKQWGRAVQDSTPLSAILLDVDYFKLFNDYYGHQTGDECLKSIAQAVNSSLLRAGDIGARYGGEEFVVLLPNTDQPGALLVAERIRATIEALKIPHRQSEISSVVTSSLGVATLFPTRINHIKDLIAIADKALYRSKREGRNRVTCLITGLEEQKSDQVTISAYNTHVNSLINEYTSSLQAFDHDTWEHSNRVAYYAIQLAEKMNLPVDLRQDLYMAGLLHDIGKTSIPFSILNKPTRLTNEEYTIIKEHPVLGYDKLIRHDFMKEKADLLHAVLYHHERWDGKGYPHGLQGENIPLSARILAVTDAFDAMTTDRIYKKGLSVQEAVEEIKRNKGVQFDPTIADIFCNLSLVLV